MHHNNGFDGDMGWNWDNDMGPGPGYGPVPDLISYPSPRRYGGGRDERYGNAYGDYRGGYGPGGGFGPPSMGPRPDFPPGPPPLMWGRGFGPGGPPFRKSPMEDRVIKYLSRCGVSRENLKNLPRDMLQLIEPQHCGLCGQSFDSFAISRLHYVSKNHLKNMKKWINQQSDAGFFASGPREMPLKARDLYCELCDVHITSKVHAESHYSGRPHRAIVEGRKVPKNPFLLQRGMESRVEQLIRREKRSLKHTEEVEDVAPKEAGPFQPELYCDICKTSVTCTEQMTMHLNGKRHLTKEKQHILKMMKGDANTNAEDDQEDQENQYDEGAEGAEDEEGNEDDENEETKDDWENGDGNWEDTPAVDNKDEVSAQDY